jgi:hypothetical protein
MLIAAETTGRICIAMEIGPRYCDVLIERWQRFAGGGGRDVRLVAPRGVVIEGNRGSCLGDLGLGMRPGVARAGSGGQAANTEPPLERTVS